MLLEPGSEGIVHTHYLKKAHATRRPPDIDSSHIRCKIISYLGEEYWVEVVYTYRCAVPQKVVDPVGEMRRCNHPTRR